MDLAQAERLDFVGSASSGRSGVLPVVSTAAPRAETLGEHFTGVVERYQAPLISFMYGMVGDREQAEDLTQEALIKAYEAMQKRRPGQQFTSGWLFRIARNTAIDAMRRKRLISWLPFGAEHEAHLPVRGDFAGQLADRDIVRQVLARLPARYRECLILRSVAGLSNGEIGLAMGITERNVNVTLFRARERFRQVFHELEHAAPQPATDTRQGGRR